jgi:hypothetical protein
LNSLGSEVNEAIERWEKVSNDHFGLYRARIQINLWDILELFVGIRVTDTKMTTITKPVKQDGADDQKMRDVVCLGQFLPLICFYVPLSPIKTLSMQL